MNAERLLEHYERIADAPDAIARLRRFILDLAVRGKLVPQDPNDEPASELLKRLERKLSLATRKARRGVESEGEEPEYSLPSNWLWARIGDHLELINGMAFKPTDWLQSGLKIVRIQNLNRLDAPFNHCDRKSIRERFLVDDGAFLISWSGTPGTSFGAFIWNRGPAVLNQHIFRCDFRLPAFDPQYLRLAINGRLDEMIAKAHGGVGLQHITKGKLEALLIALPPLAEQRRIVAKVDELMALCNRLEAARGGREATRDRLAAASLARLNAPDPATFQDDARFALDTLPALTTRPDQIKHLRQTILNLAVVGKLSGNRPSTTDALLELRVVESKMRELALRKPKKIPEVSLEEHWCELPEGWLWVRWDQISDWITYGFTRPMPHVKDGIPIITGKNVNGGKIIFETAHRTSKGAYEALSEKDRPTRGDILVTKDGSIGRSAIVDAEGTFCINQSVAVLWLRSCHFNRRFLQLAIDCPQTQSKFLAKTEGVAIKHISVGDLGQMVFPLPPLAEQRRIVANVDAMMLCANGWRQASTPSPPPAAACSTPSWPRPWHRSKRASAMQRNSNAVPQLRKRGLPNNRSSERTTSIERHLG